MRTGLIAVGAAFALVGAAGIVGILESGNAAPTTRTTTASVEGLSGGDWRPFVFTTQSGDPATLTLSWYASSGQPDSLPELNVSLYAAQSCPPATAPCLMAPMLAAWNGSGPGQWSSAGESASIYVLYVSCCEGNNASVNFTATLVEQYRTGGMALPPVPFAVTMVGSGLLTGVGSVALYLGLFLPSGVYTPADPVDPGGVVPVHHPSRTPPGDGPGGPGPEVRR